MKHDINSLPTGWKFKSTPSHGYFHLPKKDRDLMPAHLSVRHPFEEDCDWAIPVYFFKERFDEKTVEDAKQSLMDWNWQVFEELERRILEKGESFLKDGIFFYQENAGKEIVTCAWGDWKEGVPKGFVLVCANKISEDPFSPIDSSEEKYYLVSGERYDNKDRWGYLVQPDDAPITLE